jgi:hypothetical protein
MPGSVEHLPVAAPVQTPRPPSSPHSPDLRLEGASNEYSELPAWIVLPQPTSVTQPTGDFVFCSDRFLQILQEITT